MRNLQDRAVQCVVITSGILVVLVVFAILFYLGGESRYALKQGFGYGYRFALGPTDPGAGYEVEFDPNATLLASNAEGEDGLDSKDEAIPMPDLATLQGYWSYGTGTALTRDIPEGAPEGLYRDDWRSLKPAENGDTFVLFAFGTPEHRGSTMVLRWEPDASFDPASCPFQIRLRLLRTPDGIEHPPVDIDLSKQPSGEIEIPAWVARTDDERTEGYVFAMEAIPTTSTLAATARNFLRTDWAPTLVYPRFGALPLLLGTLLIVGVAVLVATPASLALAVFLGEVAPSRLREWLKPIVELLASVPTVVLGYFGVMLVAPALQQVLAPVTPIESGRMLLTAALVMAVLLVPTIATMAEDALRSVPDTMRDGSEALGLTARESFRNVLMPAARPGLIAAVLLGLARGIGETMIVWMLSGGTALMPDLDKPFQSLLQPSSGIPDRIGIEMGNVAFEGAHYGHLFLLGATLYLITLSINIAGFRMARRAQWQVS